MKYVISDMMLFTNGAGDRDCITGYWDGKQISSKFDDGLVFDSIGDIVGFMKDSSFDFMDPAVHEIDIKDYKCTLGKFLDIVQEFGSLGGK